MLGNRSAIAAELGLSGWSQFVELVAGKGCDAFFGFWIAHDWINASRSETFKDLSLNSGLGSNCASVCGDGCGFCGSKSGGIFCNRCIQSVERCGERGIDACCAGKLSLCLLQHSSSRCAGRLSVEKRGL